MSPIKHTLRRMAAQSLPGGLRAKARKLYYRGRHPDHPGMRKFGTVQDLYYWVKDGNLDTLLVLQNYFSALYPMVDTATKGTVSMFDDRGTLLGKVPFSLANRGGQKLRASALLERLEIGPTVTFGTLEVRIAIPKAVLETIQDHGSLYFWDRFYIGYSNRQGQICFVHGVDRTHIFRDGSASPQDWYDAPGDHQWAPEIPVDLDNYQTFSVIMVNRTSKSADVTLTLSDSQDRSASWSAPIPAKGVHRFQLDSESCADLDQKELRMRIQGMPSRFGRPVVFKEFRNGAISAMHC